ncbi:hybrid sensor histidine kinase/response regulator transcription factor [Mucilaginibacter terrae]|uniref:histidine kinase n=1 Tax=Mucilaginibacter terrae TaxID=1955052 RepID=A0ABU3GNK7_9SPHI|nr:two-component regulator propeller domain-containing protein [Mucilaginibacter terrae]MDT3401363.1 signal transduction histidine kinase/ligand-binding sensor domain-containing protein/DNA-binding response OmpR family regulator [Mucilaginibacter terrae]
MKKYLLLLISAVFMFSVGAFAQGDQYQFSRLNVNNGLSHNRVTCIYKDSKGFMWFGTKSGLNRYDGYRFKVFKHNINDASSISDDYIISITTGPENKLWVKTRNGFNIYNPLTDRFEHRITATLKQYNIPDSLIVSVKNDGQGNFWFLHANNGVYKYFTATRKLVHLPHEIKSSVKAPTAPGLDLSVDSKGNAWAIYQDGTLEQVNPANNKVLKRVTDICKAYPNELIDYQLSIDNDDDLWVYAPLRSNGVFYVNPAKNIFKQLGKDVGTPILSSNIVFNVIQDDEGLVWVATDHGGVNLVNKNNFKVKVVTNRPDDNRSLSQDCITSLYRDNANIIWLGTFKKGINYYHKDIIKFPLYCRNAFGKSGLTYDDINKFIEDDKGNIWIGSNGGGLIYFNRATGKFTTYLHSDSDPQSLSNNVIASLCLDHEQKLWIGTYFGGLDWFDGKKFTHYKHSLTDTNSISDNSVWEIMEDSKNRLWVGTLAGGLNLFDKERNRFHRYLPGMPNSVPHQYVSGLLEDDKGNILVGTYQGLAVLNNRTGRFTYYKHSEGDKSSLSNDNISNIMMDSRKMIWIATNEGLSLFNSKTGKFKNFRKTDGLPDNSVLTVVEDNAHNLWMSTPNGISNMVFKSNKGHYTYDFINYDQTDGLQGKEFNEDAGLKTRNGDIIFGGANGFNLFNPRNIKSTREKPVLVLTNLQVFNKSITTGEKVNGEAILQNSITETKAITLKHNQNVVSIEFAAISFFNPAKMKHAYMLEGFDRGWTIADNQIRKASYTNLDPGSYTFRLKVAGEDGIWRNEQLELRITVLPPIWRTTWAYLLYALLVCGGLLYLRYRGIKKLKANFAVQQERQESQRMRELDLMKIKFFTNVSHEFRTPLSLILAPVSKLIGQTSQADIRKQLLMIDRNAKRLLNLVNQLLDFRKMEEHELKLNAHQANIIKFIEEAAYSFSDIAENKNITLSFVTRVELLVTSFDQDKVERILFNLLSNAFKFTPEGGKVEVYLGFSESAMPGKQYLEIKVIDNGIGIPPEKLERIFDRFFQNDTPGSIVNQGSGIGLALTREFVSLHNGTIKAESSVNGGSSFTVLLPVSAEHVLHTTDVNIQIQQTAEQQTKDSLPVKASAKVINANAKKQTILLVEDNDDFRFYLKDNLKEHFNILEAVNGKDGWQKALSLHPNLIVTDISMPEMTGTALCHKIKQDSRVQHIPVILLTALTGKDDEIKGLETGANDYLTKPFDFEILLYKIKNLLNQQVTLKKTYQKQVDLNTVASNNEVQDEKFMKDLLRIIDEHIADTEFSVEELSSHMAMSRVTLYRKVLLITEKTPVEFIKFIRIKHSAHLLQTTHLNIAEIAYRVGFNNPKYYAKTFKLEYNLLPTEYRLVMQQKKLEDQLINQ